MKNFTSIILFLTICLGSMAQKAVIESPRAFTHHKALTPVKNQPVMNLKSKKSVTAGQRAAAPIQIITNPNYTDSVYFSDNIIGSTYERLVPFRLGSGLPTDSFHDGDLRWVAAQFDTIIDINTGQGYTLANTPVSVDSIYYPYSYQRQTDTTVIDTLFITIYKGDITLHGGVDNGFITNTVLQIDTILLGVGDTVPDGFSMTKVDNPNYTFATPTKFSIGFDFRGDTTNTFIVIGGFGEACGNACAALPTSINNNTQYDEINYFINNMHQFSSVIEFVYFGQCNPTANGAYDSASCELNLLQDLNIYTFMTITPPLTVNVTSTAPAGGVCPNAQFTLSAAAIGGTGPYTYTWAGSSNGAIANAFDSTTIITPTIVTGPTDTLRDTVTVIDASDDTTIFVVKTVMKGVQVNPIPNDTVACGATVTLTATFKGYTGPNTNIQWVGNSVPGATYLGVGAGSYKVNVTNAIGCTASGTAEVISTTGNTASIVAIQENPKTGALNTSGTICVNGVDSFANTSIRVDNWTWTWNWTNSGGNNFTGTNLVLDANTLLVGSDTIIVQGDSSGCTVSASKVVTVLNSNNNSCKQFLGISGIDLSEMVSIFPNPTTGMFNISFDGVESSKVNINVYDILGRDLYTESNFAVNGKEVKTIDLTKNANGIYFVRVQVDGQPYTVKVNLNK